LNKHTEKLLEGAMDILLTDEEIQAEVKAVMQRLPGSTKPAEYMKQRDRAIARAAARKVVEWLFSPCKEHHLNDSTPPLRINCYICRKAIEQEVGL